MLRREFLFSAAAAAAPGRKSLTHRERVFRALAGRDVDRPPFTFWQLLEPTTPEQQAETTLRFHAAYRTDIVKVTNTAQYPRGTGANWYELKPEVNPYPQQIRTLELIREGLGGSAPFIETVWNPWTIAERLSSPSELQRLMAEAPSTLLEALDAITQSQISHAKRAIVAGAAGVFVAVPNAHKAVLLRTEYERFSLPFDRWIFEEVSGGKLNTLHVNLESDYLDLFRNFPTPVVNYSLHATGIPIDDVRRTIPSAIAAGIDEVNFRNLDMKEMEAQWRAAQAAAGGRFILSPGGPVPSDAAPEELSRLPELLGA